MSNPFVGEIRMFAGTFAPVGWAFCDGALVPISENETLFQLIGTTYGGDGVSTFALPDLRGRSPLHWGTSISSGTVYTPGQSGGTETVTLTPGQIPAHAHRPQAAVAAATTGSPAGAVWAAASTTPFVPAPGAPAASFAPDAVAPAGGGQPHENRHPVLAVSFIISLVGLFPVPA